jgi:PAS domain S-box-containing protein
MSYLLKAAELNVLLLQDNVDDTLLMVHELERCGFNVCSRQVDTEAGFLAALETPPDVILADYSLVSIDPFRALDLLREHNLKIPLIVVSDQIEDSIVDECFQKGAADFIPKDRLGRLGIAVTQAIEHQRFQDYPQQFDTGYRLLFMHAMDVCIISRLSDGQILQVNHAAEAVYGYSRQELLGLTIQDLQVPQSYSPITAEMIDGDISQSIHRHKDGSEFLVESSSVEIEIEGKWVNLSIIRNINELARTKAALRESEARYRKLVELSPDAIYIQTGGKFALINEAGLRLFGAERPEQILGHSILEIMHPEFREIVQKRIDSLNDKRLDVDLLEEKCLRLDGTTVDVEVIATPFVFEGQPGALVQARDITERKRAQEQIQRQAKEFASLYETTLASTHQHDSQLAIDLLLERVVDLMGMAYAFISLYDPAHQNLRVITSKGAEPLTDMLIPMGKGLAGRVAETRQPMVVDNYQESELALPEFAEFGFTVMAGVPLIFANELVGVLSLAGAGINHRKFSEADVHLLSLFGSIAASAIHNARLFEEVHERARQLSLLYDVGLALNSVLELRPQLEKLFEDVRNILRCDRVEFFSFDQEGRAFHYVLGVGASEEISRSFKGLTLPLDASRSITGEVGVNLRPVNLPDVRLDPRYLMIDPDLRSGLWVPVCHGESLIGVITIFRTREEAFNTQEERLLVLIANQAAVAMENARLLEETRRQVQHIQSLWAIDQAILSSLDLQVTLNYFLQHVTSELGFDAASLFLYSPESQTLKLLIDHGMQSNELQKINLRLGEGHAGQVALKREMEFIEDLTRVKDPLTATLCQKGEHFISYAALPLMAKGELKGVLEMFSRTRLKPNGEWKDYLEALANQGAIAIDNGQLFDRQRQANLQLAAAYDATIDGWSRALDLRDKETEGHSQRVTELTLNLAAELGVSEKEISNYRRGAQLHDIGKMGVPDHILLKPGPLTAEEWEIMRRHPLFAYELLSPIGYLRPALDIPYCHHEKWDGSGYPRGLKGEKIPLAARIFAVVDVWDALTHNRPYRPSWSPEKSLHFIQEQSRKHFDPKVIEAFVKLILAKSGIVPE